MRVASKAKFFELWEAGVLGNRTRLWRDPHTALLEARRLGIKEIGFREIRPIGTTGAGKWEKVPREEIIDAANRWYAEGRKFLLDDGAPDDKRVLQGEICRTYNGMEGYLDTVAKLPIRPAMAAGHMRHFSYAACKILLDKYMDPNSRDDLDMLLELYPDAAVEFSTFSINVGIFPHRNTLFWETRDY